jgi:hypothetical protein
MGRRTPDRCEVHDARERGNLADQRQGGQAVTRIRIGFDVDLLTTRNLAEILDALQRAYEVDLATEFEVRAGFRDLTTSAAARFTAENLGVPSDLLIDRIQMTSPLLMWVAVPGSGAGFLTLLRMLRDWTAMRERKFIDNDMKRAEVQAYRREHQLKADDEAAAAVEDHLEPARLPPILEVVRDDDDPEAPDLDVS